MTAVESSLTLSPSIHRACLISARDGVSPIFERKKQWRENVREKKPRLGMVTLETYRQINQQEQKEQEDENEEEEDKDD